MVRDRLQHDGRGRLPWLAEENLRHDRRAQRQVAHAAQELRRDRSAAQRPEGAPRDPDTTQTFTAIAMKIKEPAENDEATPVLRIKLGAVGDEVNDQINQISGDGYLTPIQVIYP